MQRHAALDQNQRHVTLKPILGVDRVRELVHGLVQRFDLRILRARGVDELDEHHLAVQILVRLQQVLVRRQLEVDALEEVQIVMADEHLPAVALCTQLAQAPLGVIPRDALDEAPNVDTRGRDAHAHRSAVVAQDDGAAFALKGQPKHAAAAAQKVARVVECVEADDVRVEQCAHDLLAHGQRAVDLRAREWAVQEETDAAVDGALAQEGRQHK
mmetsp:Transcript_22018/g.68079  ORF Transcript_22018/g.68079 Transcript_22018/m.68079 type:complete len:214 (-) Transcript_22018:447-1088(-)